MMNGRVSPYNTRNVKQDVASAIVSAGLLGKFGGELLKETSGLHPTPTKKKTTLPELPTQKKPKPPDNIIVKSPSLGELSNKKPLGQVEPDQNNSSAFTDHLIQNLNDSDIHPDDLRPPHSPSLPPSFHYTHSPSPSLSVSHSLSPRDNPSTPTFPETVFNPPISTPPPNMTPTTNITPNHPILSPSPIPTFSPSKMGNKKPKIPKQETEHVEIAPSKIPEKYHMVDQFPIRPHAVEEGETLAYSNQGWQKKWFPSDKPQGRREVLQLIHTFEMMLEDLAVPQPPGTAPPLSDIEKEQTIYDTILHEIIRQVTVECADRGILLEKVSRRYRRLFARVPLILSEMQQEIDGLVDANKSLRLLLERIMESKSEAETQAKDTRDRILQVEELNIAHKLEIEQNNTIIQQLTKERDEAVTESKRQVEKHYYQERLNSELLSKDEYNKATIRSLGKQLEDAINGLHDMEAKYLSVKSQHQQEQKKVSHLNTSSSEELLRPKEESISRESSETLIKPTNNNEDSFEEEEEGEDEEMENDDGKEQPRASTADVSKGRKKLQSKFTKAATYDTATGKKKIKGKEKEKEKEKEKDGESDPPRAKTPVNSLKKKDTTLQKPSSPSSKLRTSGRMPSVKGVQNSDGDNNETT